MGKTEKRILISPDETPYKMEILVEEATKITPEAVKKFGDIVTNSKIGSFKISAVKDLLPEDVADLSEGAKKALKFGKSCIVDFGEIDNLLNAVSRADQEFSTYEINQALLSYNLIREGNV
ncbi:MAG: hypothetical protein WC806_04280, partial [Candidatus Gracilibacteria bacterium]